MAMRTLHQKRINDKVISKASGMGIGFHVMLCGGKLTRRLSKGQRKPPG